MSTNDRLPTFDPRLLNDLEFCRFEYYRFLESFDKSGTGVTEALSLWLLYLSILGCDAAAATEAVCRANVDRAVIVMKRQAVEISIKAIYLAVHPEKARQQLDGTPAKNYKFLSGFIKDKTDPNLVRFAEAFEEARRANPELTPTYGEVSFYDMLKAVNPQNHQQMYAKHYWLASAIIHGQSCGIGECISWLGPNRIFFGPYSMMTRRNENLAITVSSLYDMLMLARDHFGVRSADLWDRVSDFRSYASLLLNEDPLVAADIYAAILEDDAKRATE